MHAIPSLQAPPTFVRRELEYALRYPRAVHTPVGTIRFRNTRWENLEEDSPDGEPVPPIRHRSTAAWLLWDDEILGALEAETVDAENGVLHQELTWATDPISGELLECMCALNEAWDLLDPFMYGPVIHLKAFWIAPPYRGRLGFGALLDAFTSALSPKHSVVMFRSSALSDRAPRDEEWNGREAALARLYRREIGAMPLPARAGEEAWMWRPRPSLRGIIRAPDGEGPPFRD